MATRKKNAPQIKRGMVLKVVKSGRRNSEKVYGSPMSWSAKGRYFPKGTLFYVTTAGTGGGDEFGVNAELPGKKYVGEFRISRRFVSRGFFEVV